MRYLINLTLILMLCVTTSSCGTKVILRDHIALELPVQCPYTKTSDEAKASLSNQAVKEIFENKKNCTARAAKIKALVDAHNEAYSN